VRRRRLAERANIVPPAFDRQQCCLMYFARIDLPAVVGEISGRQIRSLKNPIDRLEIEFFGEIQHGEIFVIERLDLLGFGELAVDEMIVKFLVLIAVAVDVHRQKAEQLNESRIDASARALVAARNARCDVRPKPGD